MPQEGADSKILEEGFQSLVKSNHVNTRYGNGGLIEENSMQGKLHVKMYRSIRKQVLAGARAVWGQYLILGVTEDFGIEK